MKEATGELSMTVIVIIGAIAIVTILGWLGPEIKEYVERKWGDIENTDILGEDDDNDQAGAIIPE